MMIHGISIRSVINMEMHEKDTWMVEVEYFHDGKKSLSFPLRSLDNLWSSVLEHLVDSL